MSLFANCIDGPVDPVLRKSELFLNYFHFNVYFAIESLLFLEYNIRIGFFGPVESAMNFP